MSNYVRIFITVVCIIALANWLLGPHTLTRDGTEKIEDYVGKRVRFTGRYTAVGAYNSIDFVRPIGVSFYPNASPRNGAYITVVGKLEDVGNGKRPDLVINRASWSWPPGPHRINPPNKADDPSWQRLETFDD